MHIRMCELYNYTCILRDSNYNVENIHVQAQLTDESFSSISFCLRKSSALRESESLFSIQRSMSLEMVAIVSRFIMASVIYKDIVHVYTLIYVCTLILPYVCMHVQYTPSTYVHT